MKRIDKMKKNEKTFLKRLYEAYFQGKFSVNIFSFTEELNAEKKEIISIYQSLSKRGYCVMVALGGDCSITTNGLLFIEGEKIPNESLLNKNLSMRRDCLLFSDS